MMATRPVGRAAAVGGDTVVDALGKLTIDRVVGAGVRRHRRRAAIEGRDARPQVGFTTDFRLGVRNAYET